MLGTWDSYRSRAGEEHRSRPDQQRALTRFVEKVDLLFYAAAAVLGACLLGLIVG